MASKTTVVSLAAQQREERQHAEEALIDQMHLSANNGETTFHITQQFILTRVPEAIKCLKPTLRILHIDSNFELTDLPASIGDLVHLTWLNVSYNKLQTLPREIGKLRNLERLHCNNNQLVAIPPDVWSLRELQELRCETNRLRVLPGGLLFLPRLTDIVCEGNPLVTDSDLDGVDDPADVLGPSIVDGPGDCANCRTRFAKPIVFCTFARVSPSDATLRPFVHLVQNDGCKSQLLGRLAARDEEQREAIKSSSPSQAAAVLAAAAAQRQ